MSKAGEVRDAVVAALVSAFPSESVEPFVTPNYTKEELTDRRIIVRFSNRNLTLNQGPDEQQVVIDVGVIGSPLQRIDSTDPYRKEEVIAIDELETLMESIIALWMHDGSLSDCGMASHVLMDIDQAFQFDADRFYNHGIYLTMFQITYQDSRD